MVSVEGRGPVVRSDFFAPYRPGSGPATVASQAGPDRRNRPARSGPNLDGPLGGPVIEALTGTPDLAAASQLLLSEVQKLAECHIAAACSIEESQDEVITVLFASKVPIERTWGDTSLLTEGWRALSVNSALWHIAPVNGRNCPLFEDPECLDAGIKAALWIPLSRLGHILGFIGLFSQDANAFDVLAPAPAAELGDLLALPVESAARYLRSRQQEKFAQAIQRASNVINRCPDTRLALESICRECGDLLGASRVALRELEGKVLSCWVGWPPQANGAGSHTPLELPLTGVSAKVVLSGETEVLDLVASAPDGLLAAEPASLDQPYSVMAVPLLGKERVIGVLEVGQQGQVRRFTPRTIETAEAFASLAAIVLQNAQLHQETLKEKERATNLLTQLKAVLKEVDAGVLLVSDRQQVLWMNRKFGEMFGIGDIESLVKDDQPAPLSTLRRQSRSCFADPEAFFARRDPIDLDRVYAGHLGNVEIIQPAQRTLEEFTTPIRDAAANYIGRLWAYHDITALKRSEEALRHSEAQERAMLEAIPDAMFRLSRDGTYLDYIAPPEFDLIVPGAQFLGKSAAEVLPADLARRTLDAIDQALSSRRVQTLEYQLRMNDRVRDYEARVVASGDDEVLAIVRDVTERNFLEAQFLQSQKLESLGRLAGGIAHDFNNLLGGIMGYASLIQGKLDPNSEAHEFAGIIEKATQRGARLTQQLLTAARKNPFEPRSVDVTEVTQEIVQILSHTLPNSIMVNARLQPNLPPVRGDQAQIHQVLMNLCVNAADAMPDGGVLTLANQEVLLDEAFCRQHLSVRPGPYIRLSVSDTGIGISEANRPKIFDPFFTTKGPGQGTGLGLAVVYAIVKNHQGLIEVKSEVNSAPDRGSIFTVYLPVHGPNSD